MRVRRISIGTVVLLGRGSIGRTVCFGIVLVAVVFVVNHDDDDDVAAGTAFGDCPLRNGKRLRWIKR